MFYSISFMKKFFKILNKLYEITKNENLCISGGCAQNSVANGKIILNTKFKNIYVSSSSGDSGGAISSKFFLSKRNIFLKKKVDRFMAQVIHLNKLMKVF